MVRSRLALLVVLTLCVTARPANAGSPLDDQLSQQLQTACAAFSGTTGVVVADPLTGYRFGLNDQRVFPAASLYKLAVLTEAYRQAAAGQISLDDTMITITDDDLTGDGYFTASGTSLTVREAIERMIAISDNSPALALVRVLDAHQINATLLALGLMSTRLNTPLPEQERTSSSNVTTASDIATLFNGLALGQIVSPDASREMLAVLARQQINDRLPAGVPPGVTVAHKTGDLPGISHDAGMISTSSGPRIVVMLTSDFASIDDVTTLAESLGALAMRWRSTGPNAGLTDAGALPLANLGSGESIVVPVSVNAPTGAGSYVLELEVTDPVLGPTGNRMPIVVMVTAP